jgi:hypothetical protein
MLNQKTVTERAEHRQHASASADRVVFHDRMKAPNNDEAGSSNASILVDNVGPPSAEVYRTVASFP